MNKKILIFIFIEFIFYKIEGMDKNRPKPMDLKNNFKKSNLFNLNKIKYDDKNNNKIDDFYEKNKIFFYYDLIFIFKNFNLYIKTLDEKYLRNYIKSGGLVDKFGNPYVKIKNLYNLKNIDFYDEIIDQKYYSKIIYSENFINFKEKESLYKKFLLNINIEIFKNNILKLSDNDNFDDYNYKNYLNKIYNLSRYYLPNFDKKKSNEELKILSYDLELEKNNPISNLNYLQINKIEHYIKNLNNIYDVYL